MDTNLAYMYKMIDDHILENEFPALMGAKLKETIPELKSVANFEFESFLATKQEFLTLFSQLNR